MVADPCGDEHAPAAPAMPAPGMAEVTSVEVWETETSPAAVSSSKASAPSLSDGGCATTGAPVSGARQISPVVQRIHLLPIGDVDDPALADHRRLDLAAAELRRLRAARSVLSAGDVVRDGGRDFVVVKSEPEAGVLGEDTDYYFDGSPVVKFERIQFSAWGDEKLSSDQLFAEYVGPYFQGEYGPYGSSVEAKRLRLFYTDQVFKIGEVWFQVDATEPSGLGVITNGTEIFSIWDHETPEFDKVHIVPFRDTLPQAYQFDVFQDYLRPYLIANGHKKFRSHEMFFYHGVQFKLVASEPETTGRISRRTTIFCEGTLHPSLRNLLPPEVLAQVSQLPFDLQMLLLNRERTTRELEDMLTHRRGLFEETLQQLESFTWPPESSRESTQQTCMICLGDFCDGDDCRWLPCRHVFHETCADQWLRRCTDCPICKDNVDRAVRHY